VPPGFAALLLVTLKGDLVQDDGVNNRLIRW